MQYIKHRKSFLLLTLVVMLLFSSTGCAQNVPSLSKLSEGEYLVIFSEEFHKSARLCIYQNGGTLLEDVDIKGGQALRYSVKSDNGYLFTSKRINSHYLVDDTGNIQTVNFASDKYGPDRHAGTYYAAYTEGWLTSAMNIGTSSEGYACNIVFQKGLDGPQKYLPLNLGILDSSIVHNNILYIHYRVLRALHHDLTPDDADYHRYAGIYAYDIAAGKELYDITIDNRSLVSILGNPMRMYHDYILIYGDSTGNRYNQRPPCLGVFDTVSGKLIREVFFEEGFIPAPEEETYTEIREVHSDDSFLPAALHIYQDQIYLMSSDGRMKVLDSNFDTIQEYHLSDNALENFQDKKTYINKTILQGSELHVVYRFSPDKQNYQLPASIHVYDIETGVLKRITELKLEGEANWWEAVEVQLLTK